MLNQKYSLLEGIETPHDLRKLETPQLEMLCDELRCFLIDAVSENPGHLGASLGVVELTVALHRVYNTPMDNIVWDVGHQAYIHKILTGRKNTFHTNRKFGGISGFPKTSESEYDSFGVGHSSTSISAALGMATAAKHLNNGKKTVAVIGDGALTGGMAFEGLNNMVEANADVLIILNDNQMSIDAPTGGMQNALVQITTSNAYNRLKKDVWNGLGKLHSFGHHTRKFIEKTGSSMKSFFLKNSNFFDSIGVRYFGPVNGHDVVELEKALTKLKNIKGPKILHIYTLKGRGYSPAENDQTVFHAPGKFNVETGERLTVKKENTPPKYQDVFGDTLLELALENERIIGITPAMLSGCSMCTMQEVLPDRVYDVGIAEQHAITFSAGLATQGMLPFCNIYSSFAQRAYDQILHDVAIQNLDVVICLDRGGLVGADGATHHGAYDMAYLRSIPQMTIAAPMNEVELRNIMYTTTQQSCGPIAIRYPRGNGVMTNWKQEMKIMDIGKGEQLTYGDDVAIVSIGHPGNFAVEANELLKTDNIGASIFNMRFVKPLDEKLLHEIFNKFNHIVTIEDGTIVGGFGSAVGEFMIVHGYQASLLKLGIPDKFIEHGTPQELYQLCGFDAHSIRDRIVELLNH